MELERPKTSGRPAIDRPKLQRKNEEINKNESKLIRPKTGVARPQTRQERPSSRRHIDNELTPAERALQTATPTKTGRVRPPSASAYSQRGSTANTRLSSAMSVNRTNSGLNSTPYINSGMYDRPITQHGVAGMRPGTTRGPMTRQVQDKRYYNDLIQFKIRELNQEIGVISKDVQAQKKQQAAASHYDTRAKQMATRLTDLQGQLADHNIVLDKMASNVSEEEMREEIKELKLKNDITASEIARIVADRKTIEHKLREMEEELEDEEEHIKKVVKMMDPKTRKEYNELIEQKNKWDSRIKNIQDDINVMIMEKSRLEEQVGSSQVQKEAMKLYIEIGKAAEKKAKLEEEIKNKLDPDEEREQLLARVKQDNMEIAAAERKIEENTKKITEIEQELEQIETYLEESQSEEIVKYNELKKREEAIEQFMPSFEQNKQEEMKKLTSAEGRIVALLENLSYSVKNQNKAAGDDSDMFNISKFQNVDRDKMNPDELKTENAQMQIISMKMRNLKKIFDDEYDHLAEIIKTKGGELVTLEDLDSLKTQIHEEHRKLETEKAELEKIDADTRKQLQKIREEYDQLKKELEENYTSDKITEFEEQHDELQEANEKLEEYIKDNEDKLNYQPIKEQALKLVEEYNTLLQNNMKSII